MKNNSFVRYLKIAFLLLALPNCGRDTLKPITTIVLPSQSSLESGEADGSDYLVHFRVDPSSISGLSLNSFESEYQAFDELTIRPIIADPRISHVDFLTHIVTGIESLGQKIGAQSPLSMLNPATTPYQGGELLSILNIRFGSAESAKEVLRVWAASGLISYAEPNYRSSPKESYEQYLGRLQEQDSLKPWHKDINLEQALNHLATQGRAPVSPVIAVMDSGVDSGHRLLKEQMWENDRVGQADCLSDLFGCNTTVGVKGVLGNGDTGPYRIDGAGRCPVASGGDCARDCCHGSHVAGIIAAYRARDTLDMNGVCPMCKIMAIRVVGKSPTAKEAEGTILDSSIIRGLKYVSRFYTDDGTFLVRVVNASFGKFQRSRTVSLLIRLLKNTANGVLVIAAAGNEDTMKRNYPAGYSDVLAVSNIHTGQTKQKRSNFGNWVEIAAPGSDIFSTVPGEDGVNDIERKSGTSMSSPVVAGVAGLLLSFNPDISFADLRERLIRTANQDLLYSNAVNKRYFPPIPGANSQIALLGSGMVDAEAVVKKEFRSVPINEASNRVTTSCATISLGMGSSAGMLVLMLMLLPAIFGLRTRKKAKNAQ